MATTYATVADVQARMINQMTERQQTVCSSLLEGAARIIDAFNVNASADSKNEVSVRMVQRAIASSTISDIPIGSTQGSMSAMGYSQSWTMGTNASVGQLYLDRTDKRLLGGGSKVGSYSPVEELVYDGN